MNDYKIRREEVSSVFVSHCGIPASLSLFLFYFNGVLRNVQYIAFKLTEKTTQQEGKTKNIQKKRKENIGVCIQQFKVREHQDSVSPRVALLPLS